MSYKYSYFFSFKFLIDHVYRYSSFSWKETLPTYLMCTKSVVKFLLTKTISVWRGPLISRACDNEMCPFHICSDTNRPCLRIFTWKCKIALSKSVTINKIMLFLIWNVTLDAAVCEFCSHYNLFYIHLTLPQRPFGCDTDASANNCTL